MRGLLFRCLELSIAETRFRDLPEATGSRGCLSDAWQTAQLPKARCFYFSDLSKAPLHPTRRSCRAMERPAVSACFRVIPGQPRSGCPWPRNAWKQSESTPKHAVAWLRSASAEFESLESPLPLEADKRIGVLCTIWMTSRAKGQRSRTLLYSSVKAHPRARTRRPPRPDSRSLALFAVKPHLCHSDAAAPRPQTLGKIR